MERTHSQQYLGEHCNIVCMSVRISVKNYYFFVVGNAALQGMNLGSIVTGDMVRNLAIENVEVHPQYYP